MAAAHLHAMAPVSYTHLRLMVTTVTANMHTHILYNTEHRNFDFLEMCIRDRLENMHEHDHEHHHHDHEDHHDHGHHHHHEHGEYQDAHARAHANDIKRRFDGREVTNWQILLFGLTGGLIPCPAAITVLLICIQLKALTLGATLVVSFSLGPVSYTHLDVYKRQPLLMMWR